MTAIQLYYVNTVLGISSIIQPQKIRSIYRIHPSSAKSTDFLFFCHQLHTEEEKSLIQKIGKTLSPYENRIVEILADPTEKPTEKKELSLNTAHSESTLNKVMKNLLTRFLPKGFIVFGSDLAIHLTSTKNTTEKIVETVPISHHQNQSIPGCVLHSIHDMVDSPNSTETQERKKQTWNNLKKFLQK